MRLDSVLLEIVRLKWHDPQHQFRWHWIRMRHACHRERQLRHALVVERAAMTVRSRQNLTASFKYRRSRSKGGNVSRDPSHSSISLAPFELLHDRHDQTMLSPSSGPPRCLAIR